MPTTLFRRASVITANARGHILHDTDILIDGNRITGITKHGTTPAPENCETIDASGLVLIPGFVQTHIHVCQTLFRGLADDLQLLDWLQKKIFPFEAAHSAESMNASAAVGVAELIRSGTTTILDMGSVNHEDEIICAIGEMGMRAFVGKAMMDQNDLFPGLKESTSDALRSTRDLAERWHNSYDGRIRYAAAPRFVLSCTDTLLHATREMIENFSGMLLHTHASENTVEVQAVRERCKMENIEYLHHLKLLSDRTCLAHCVHVNEREIEFLAETQTNIAHCPSSNLKLGSGIATIPHLLSRRINVSLGADGAPCNNTLDMFQEMRLASLLQKPAHGPTAMDARTVFEMATICGARALGLAHEIGSIEVGKKADCVLLDLDRVWNPLLPDENLYSSIVFSAGPENVHSVMIDGRWVYRNKQPVGFDEGRIREQGRTELKKLLDRM